MVETINLENVQKGVDVYTDKLIKQNYSHEEVKVMIKAMHDFALSEGRRLGALITMHCIPDEKKGIFKSKELKGYNTCRYDTLINFDSIRRQHKL